MLWRLWGCVKNEFIFFASSNLTFIMKRFSSKGEATRTQEKISNSKTLSLGRKDIWERTTDVFLDISCVIHPPIFYRKDSGPLWGAPPIAGRAHPSMAIPVWNRLVSVPPSLSCLLCSRTMLWVEAVLCGRWYDASLALAHVRPFSSPKVFDLWTERYSGQATTTSTVQKKENKEGRVGERQEE